MIAGKSAVGAVPRKFGTSLSVNTNVPSAAAAPLGKAPTLTAPVPSKPVLACAITSQSSLHQALPDSVTSADVAGAMDIDIADR